VFRKVLWFTFWQALASTALTLVVGLPGAYLLARFSFRGKSLFRAITGIPFVMPTLVVAAAFNALLGPQGWANILLQDWFGLPTPPIQFINTIWAILIAHVFYNTTIVLRMVGDFWGRLDPRLEQAGRVLGANRFQSFTRITLPLLMPAITAAAVLIFIFDFSSFAVILVLGGPAFATLEVEIFYQVTALFNLPMAAVLSLLQLTCTLALTILYSRLSHRVARPLQLRTSSRVQQPLRTWRMRLGAGVTLGGLLVLLTLPLAALAARSVTHLGAERTRSGLIERGLTTIFYESLIQNETDPIALIEPARAISVSLGYASATVFLALLLGLPAAWALAHHQKSRISRLLDPLLMMPLGTSAVTLGLGFLVAFNKPPLQLSTSPLLLPLAHTLVAFPFVIRSLVPALQSIQPQLRQAAAVMGATPLQVVRFIDVPLVGRALLAAAVFAFTISLGEFGATALISRPEYPTIPFAIYRLLGRPGALNYGQALALSTLLMMITAGGMLVIERLRMGEISEF
jgi:thiamine transport system permease protein